ncbi:MAG: NAD(P)/FAD-dependent oxidoreductase [Desulfomonilaceae bacterium]
MARERCVIIGNGPAANAAAAALRQETSELDIMLIGEESFPHYRPHLLPAYVAGRLSKEDLYATPASFYEECDIRIRLGQRVTHVKFDRRELVLSHKEIVPFDALIIACGGMQRIPERLQIFEDLLLTLKTPADAQKWRAGLKTAETILLLGGDLTSLSFARALVSTGKRVQFILQEQSFWPLPLTPALADEVKERLTRSGVQVLDASLVHRFTKLSPHVIEVETDAGAMTANLVGAFYGLAPNVKFLVRSGLDVERGVLVDENLRTRFDLVYAAGDCAQIYHPDLRDYWVSIGYNNAIEQGKIAAKNLAGGMTTVAASPANIFCVEGVMVNTSWWMEF